MTLQKSGTTAWSWFDGGNSVVHLIALTIVLPWVFDADWHRIAEVDSWARALGEKGDRAWGTLAGVSILIASALSFVFGRMIDTRNARKIFFFSSTALSILSLISVVCAFNAYHAYIVSSVALLWITFTITLYAYDVMMIDSVGGQSEQGLASASAAGWSLGYLVSAFVLLVLYYLNFFQFGDWRQISKILIISLLLYGGVSLLTARFWPEEYNATPGASANPTAKKNITWFLLGGLFVTEAVATLSVFITLMSKNVFNQGLAQTVELFLYFHAIAIFSTFFLTRSIAVRFTARDVGYVLAISWLSVSALGGILIHFGYISTAFWLLLVGLGLLVGTTPAALRAVYAQLIPAKQRGQYFSYAVVTQRLFAFIGPIGATAILAMTGNYAYILLLIAGFQLVAIACFSRISRS